MENEYPNLTPDNLEKESPFDYSSTYYDSGKIKCERFFTDDHLLLKEIHYSPAGQIREIVNYKKDGTKYLHQYFQNEIVKSGLALTYYESGAIQSQKYYVDGKVHWEEKIFGPEGQLLEIITYIKGGKTGVSTIFNQLGGKISEITYKDNQPEGISRFYYDNGQLKAEISYIKGKKNGVSKIYYQNGVMKVVESMRDDIRDGLTKTFYENGGSKEEWYFLDGELNGNCKFFYRTGQLFGTKNYENGKEEGLSQFFYKSGKLKEEITYHEGNKWGVSKVYDEYGNVQVEYIYKDNEIIEEKRTTPLSHEASGTSSKSENVRRNINYFLIFSAVLIMLYLLYAFILYVV
ncbi:MAG TPA: toxin-antitoxin system YwqK family antitoxin [Ignavibacteriales bacterium]|nr:toxin-antitoxin system YwqK family antitoxin [Ignavibacteriales bacterium]